MKRKLSARDVDPLSVPQAPVTAVLGPTNTGKTHYAMERMLAQRSGMIGFPLRLLARENYDKACRLVGAPKVALVTGEEKIIPPAARYFLATVEAMPVDQPVEFLAIDEVQMCADPERGHVFTERVLNARGISETLLLGSETMRGVLEALIPNLEVITRPRLSTLSYRGHKKTSRLPPRSAVVGFSADAVYGLAEQVRRQRGGAAVVLGALSPRTRNAQVAMYQAGEVDYLVATDAIGMGLNMDIDHVAFAGTAKFDGVRIRRLTPPELAQAAGRAGRHTNDGTFGTTADEPPMAPEVIEAIETHTFDPVRRLYWRSAKLDFSSVEALLETLRRRPPHRALARSRPADDERALTHLLEEADVRELATGGGRVELLWDVCRVPDFQGVLSHAHARMLAQLYVRLVKGEGRLPEDWFEAQVARADRIEGDIDALTQRIAAIRIWTYVSFHPGWLEHPTGWQEKTRAIEDRLSEALHERLTQRFVDKDTARLVKRLGERADLLAAVNADGAVVVEGQIVGRMDGFRFEAERMPEGAAGRSVLAAATPVLRGEVKRRAGVLSADGDGAFDLRGEDGAVLWRGAVVARLVKGETVLSPGVRFRPADLLEPRERDQMLARLRRWLKDALLSRLPGLGGLEGAPLSGAAKGIAFDVCRSLGSVPRARVQDQLTALTRENRQDLRALGLRIGRESVFLPALLKPNATAFKCLLWGLFMGQEAAPPPPGRTSVAAGPEPDGYFDAIGFRRFGAIAVRIDTLERIAARAHALTRHHKPGGGAFPAGAELMTLAGCGADGIRAVLKGLGFKAREVDGVWLYRRSRVPGDAVRRGQPADQVKAKRPPRRRKTGGTKETKPRVGPAAPAVDADSPFAVLGELLKAR